MAGRQREREKKQRRLGRKNNTSQRDRSRYSKRKDKKDTKRRKRRLGYYDQSKNISSAMTRV